MRGEILVHYLLPASVLPHPKQTKWPAAGKWIFLHRRWDKKERGRKNRGGEESRTTSQKHLNNQAQNQFKFLSPACLLSPPLPPCWPDRGSSLHQSPPWISHLFYWEGQVLALSSAHAGKSPFLLFVSQVRDDPRLSAIPPLPLQYALQPLLQFPLASLDCIQRDKGELVTCGQWIHNTSHTQQSNTSDKTRVKVQKRKVITMVRQYLKDGLVRLSPHTSPSEQVSLEMRRWDKRVSIWLPPETLSFQWNTPHFHWFQHRCTYAFV